MLQKRVLVPCIAFFLLIAGLLLLYYSNINKTVFIDISADSPFIIDAEKQAEGVSVIKKNEKNYTVSLPSTFFYETKTIQFQNTDNETVQLKFYTQQKKDGDKTVKFSANVKKITVNEKVCNTKKQTIWYEQPYLIDIKAENNKNIFLTVQYKTKFMLRNVFLPTFIASIVLLIVLTAVAIKYFFMNPLRKGCQYLVAILEKYGEWDIHFLKKYHDIDLVYKKTFWTVFIILHLVFLYYSIHFLWGNHDWWYVTHGMWKSISWWNGRFTNYLPNQLLGGRFLPLLTMSLALFGFSFTGILLAYYWKVEKRFFNYLVISLVIVLNPLVLYWIYFAIDTVSHLWIPSILILALILSEKKSYFYFFLAYLLIIMGLGAYSSGINTIAIVFLGKVILSYCFEDQSIVFLYTKFKRTFLCIIAGLISFKIIISMLIFLEKTQAVEYVSTNLLNSLGKNFFKLVVDSFANLWYSVPFYDHDIVQLTIFISLFSFIVLCWYQRKYTFKKISQWCLFILGICLLPLALNTTSFVLGFNKPEARILFFGNIFFVAFFIAVILKTKLIWAKNILIVFLIFLLPMNVYRLVEAQKLWKMDFDYQNGIHEQILKRIVESPNYVEDRTYTVICWGSQRSSYLLKFYDANFDSYDVLFFTRSAFAGHAFPNALKFYNFNSKVNYFLITLLNNENINIAGQTNINIYQILLPYYDLLKSTVKQWPAKNSVLVNGDCIFINFDDKTLETFLKILDEKRLEVE